MLNGSDYGGNRRHSAWWDCEGAELCQEVIRSFEFLEKHQHYRAEANRLHMSMYSNRLASGMTGSEYLAYSSSNRLKLNVCKAVVDTATAHIASNRPRIVYLTKGGKGSQRSRAKNLTKFVAGTFQSVRQYTHVSQPVFQEGAIFGNGFDKVWERNGRISSERVTANEIQVDDREALYGSPMQLWQHKEVERHHYQKLYPEHADELSRASLVDSRQHSIDSLSDPISVIEATILPSEPGADDGRRVLGTTSCVLEDEVWESPRFAIVPWRWSMPPLGFWGIGIIEELAPIQAEINMLLIRAQESLQYSGMQLWMQKSERTQKITNKPGGVNYYANNPPVNVPVGGIPPMIVDQIENLYRKAFEIPGISQLAAMSQKPAGLNSGVAIREFNDTQSQRFLHVGQRWEQLHIDIGEEMIQRGREIQERGGSDMKVLAAGSRDVEEISFKDVAIPRDEYTCRAYPSSLLPDTPTGQLSAIQELAQANPDMARYMTYQLEHPDLEAFMKMANSHIEMVDYQIERMLDKGEPQTPQPYMDLAVARQRVTMALLRAEKDETPEEKLETARTYLSLLDQMEANAQAASAPPAPQQPQQVNQPMPPEAMPPGMPMM